MSQRLSSYPQLEQHNIRGYARATRHSFDPEGSTRSNYDYAETKT